MTDPDWIYCPYCAACTWNSPPHGEGQPCPLKLEMDKTTREMLDAQRMSYVRSGAAIGDMSSIFGKLTGQEDDDDS